MMHNAYLLEYGMESLVQRIEDTAFLIFSQFDIFDGNDFALISAFCNAESTPLSNGG
jgi:hypothetical protein